MKIGYRLTWKCIKGEYPNKKTKGTIDIWALTEEEAKHQFLINSNIFGRQFEVTSVTEIDRPKPKKTNTIEPQHGNTDRQPDWDDIPT